MLSEDAVEDGNVMLSNERVFVVRTAAAVESDCWQHV